MPKIIDNGACNGTILWSLDDEGTLIVTGIGDMPNYATIDAVPWGGTLRSMVKKVVFQSNICSIGKYAFAFCDNLTDVILSDSIIEVNHFAFSHCCLLNNIIMSKKLKHIRYLAFDSCYSLFDVVLPNSVNFIDGQAFENCVNLENVTMPQNVTLGTDVFKNCPRLQI